MRVEVVMPRLSDSMSEGSVTAWFKEEGEAVAEGEAIAELETEKSTVDLVAPAAGTLACIAVAAGSGNVAVGTLLAEIETEATAAAVETKTTASALPSRRAAKAAPTPIHAVAAAPVQRAGTNTEVGGATVASVINAASDEAVAATPLARRMAAQAGLSLSSLARTGIGGKICKADVEAALGRATPLSVVSSRTASTVLARRGASTSSEIPAAAAPGQVQPLSRVRRTIAGRMALAKATIPHFYLSVDCRVDRLLDVRRRLKEDGLAISINDFVVRAAAIALGRVPEANASWAEGGGIVHHDRIDIAVAVAIDDGLVTPVLRSADTLGLGAIGETVRDLAARARDGALAPHEYDGATFTISNLGMHGVGEMFAIINPPQACILGIGAAEPKPVVEDGRVVAGTVMTLSLSADHRVIDGTGGARLLAEIRRLLEEPARMLV